MRNLSGAAELRKNKQDNRKSAFGQGFLRQGLSLIGGTKRGNLRETIFDQFNRAPQWKPYVRFAFTRIELIDGTTTRSLYLMKKQGLNGEWQHRRMTDEEFWK
jgi:hypothetical protein